MFDNIKLWIASFFRKKEKKEEVKPNKDKFGFATNHAKDRFGQRHGVLLTDHMVDSFVHDIEKGQAEFLKDKKNNTQSWIVTYENKKYRVIYNPAERLIITVFQRVENKKTKPSRRIKNKINKRNHIKKSVKRDNLCSTSLTLKKNKEYKRNKRVDYYKAI